MSQTDNLSENASGQWLSKVDMIEKISEQEAHAQHKSLVISGAGEQPADVAEVAKSLDIQPDSSAFTVLKIFCEKEKTSDAHARMFAQRITSLSDEHNNFLKRICENSGFSAQVVLDLVPSLKKISGKGLLLLHGFADVKGFGPGPLNRFFVATIPQLDRSKDSPKAIKREKQEKAVSSFQIDLFYNICTKLPDLDADTVLSVLPILKKLKEQHARMLTIFLDKDAVFNEKPISNHTLPGLIQLWASMPEISDKSVFEKLVKKLSHQSGEKKHDLKLLTLAFKSQAEKQVESGSKIGNVFKNMLP